MSDESIIVALREAGALEKPVALVRRLSGLLGEKISAKYYMSFFGRAFPEIPIHTLMRSSLWFAEESEALSDSEFEKCLSDWIPLQQGVDTSKE